MSRPSSSQLPPSPLSLPQATYPSSLPATPLKRRRSNHLLAHPTPVPIPPSLLQSPYLSPQNTSARSHLSAPRLPSREDELWLQDTIPLHSHQRHPSLERVHIKSPGPGPSQWSPSHSASAPTESEHTRGRRDPSLPNLHRHAAHSPHPLLYRRVPPPVYPTRPQWLTHGQTRSEPVISHLQDHSYFPALASLRR